MCYIFLPFQVNGRIYIKTKNCCYQTSFLPNPLISNITLVKIESFRNSWNYVLTGQKKRPDEDSLEYMYYEAVKEFRGIAQNVAHYNMIDEVAGGDRSYEFLYDSVQRFIRRTKQSEARAATQAALRGNPSKPGAPAPKVRAKAKGKRPGEKRRNNKVEEWY